MSDERQMMAAQYALIEYNEAWQCATDLKDEDEPAFKAGWDAAQERIADLAAEVEHEKNNCDNLREEVKDLTSANERLKGLLREWSHLGSALLTGARMPNTVRELAERTDQQLQPTQDMRPNPNRQGTPHEHAHERTLACSAPPKCQQLQLKGEQG